MQNRRFSVIRKAFLCLFFVTFLYTGAKSESPLPASKDWGYFSGGTIHILPTSHQDIAWMDSPEKCAWWRDTQLITPALDILAEHDDYCIFMEDVLMLKEYLGRHPERKDDIIRWTKEGRLEWGATYNQPYESLLSGEQLVRQTYLGRKWLRTVLPGCDAHLAWNVDVPARSLQMPQILHRAGIKYLVLSRFEQGIYQWQSPDGSGVLAYSPDKGHYSYPRDLIQGGYDEVAGKLSARLNEWSPYYSGHSLPPSFCIIDGRDFEQSSNYYPLIEKWNGANENKPPELRYSTATRFMESIAASGISPDTIMGERPNEWLYIHGPAHHWAISAMREAGRILPAAESFAAFDALTSGGFDNYPSGLLEEAWAQAIFPDHGWGGRNGDITDHLFRTKLESARDTGVKVLTNSLTSIASRVKTKTTGLPLIVFNTLSFRRSDPVVCEFNSTHSSFELVDAEGRRVPHQAVPYSRHLIPMKHENTFENKTVQIAFIARDVPALGYKTYYIVPASPVKTQNTVNKEKQNGNVIENRFYKITLAGGGIKSIYDKELGREILRSETFLGGDIFTLKSEGNGAGEFDKVQQPTLEGFDKISAHAPEWNRIESGPVRDRFEYRQEMAHCTVITGLTVYTGVKRIDFDTALMWFDGTKSREYRFALPVNMADAEIAYEVPMGVVEVGRSELKGPAGERYMTECKDIHPREVQNFISANNDDFGVTLSSCVAVCDYIDPVNGAGGFPVLQPVLLASRKSCHGWGNWFLQPGDHHYSFSFTSHSAGWRNGMRSALQANNPLIPVIRERGSRVPILPEEACFLETTLENILVSTVKKCDDDNSLIVRFYETHGRDSDVSFTSLCPFIEGIRTNIIEDEESSFSVDGRSFSLPVGHNAIETIKLKPDWSN